MASDADTTSIRPYRARKDRPCDNCRVRRRGCVIPRVGEPCELCAQTRKQCTFLRDRPRRRTLSEATSGRENSNSTSIADSSTARAASPVTTEPLRHQSNYSVLPISPVTIVSPAAPPLGPSLGVTGLIDLVRESQRPFQSNQGSYVGQALDDEAADDEELYLVGTAVEKDALVLDQLASEGGGGHSRSSTGDTTGIRVRVVSPTVSFVFYRSSPYDFENGRGEGVYAQVKGLMDDHVAQDILERFHIIEGKGFPIFSPYQQPNDCLKAFCLTAGLIYTPSLRSHHKSAYVATMTKVRQRAPRARLWVLQVYLLDLNGREAINPSGNFIVLGQAISIACLLGLNEDCTYWSIPQWEKDLRKRLWWALEIYDVFSALSFGRTRSILFNRNIPHPDRQEGDASLTAFVYLCELAVILDRLLAHSKDGYLNNLSEAASSLDEWRSSLDSSGVLVARDPNNNLVSGVRSLYLAYLGVSLTIVREVWNSAANIHHIQIKCQETCLKACVDIVDFVADLTENDLRGYWASCGLPVHVVLLSDIAGEIDRIFRPAGSARYRYVADRSFPAEKRFITLLTKARNNAQWDVAELALSRASHFIPRLTRRTSEIQVALLPLGDEISPSQQLPTQTDNTAVDDFLASLLQSNDLDQLMTIPAFPDVGVNFDWLGHL